MFSNLRPDPWHHLLWRAEWWPLHWAHYIRIEKIEGLPAPTAGASGREMVSTLECLRQPDRWQYSDYFFHESLRLLCRTAQPPPVIHVVYTEGGRRHEIEDYAREAADCPPHYLRLALFPYTLLLDPGVRHCD